MGFFLKAERERETRDLTFNEWHRRQEGLAGVDIDFVEICKRCQKPLGFIELVYDTGSNDINAKCALITGYVAWKMFRPCYVVFYKVNGAGDDLIGIKVKQVRPSDGFVVEMTPNGFAAYLRYLHRDHAAICVKASKGDKKKYEIERGKRMTNKINLEQGVVPMQYDDEEVIIHAGQIVDIFMEGRFAQPAGEEQEDRYDHTRNRVVEVMEGVMRSWRGQADVPLPIELVVSMTNAGADLLVNDLFKQ